MRSLIGVLLAAPLLAAPAATVRESARRIPVAHNVDVVVVGGSTGAVSAALAASSRGARVFLAAPRPYLGEDLCATMRLWLEPGEKAESPLARRLFGDTRGPLRPMHVKKTLDDALLEAKIPFLYPAYITDVLTDGRGRPAGVVIANRAGRQAVVARVVIDATETGLVARMAGARFQPFPAGAQTFQRIAVGGRPRVAVGVSARRTGLTFHAEADARSKTPAREAELIEYTLDLPVADGSWAARAEAEQAARDLTYGAEEAANTEQLFQVPPQPIRGEAGGGLAPFRPAGVPRLYVLGGAADLPRDAAARLLRPAAFIDAGTMIGAAAAVEAAGIAEPGALPRVLARDRAAFTKGDVKEILAGLRGMEEATSAVESPSRALPVLGSFDVVVAGGGTGGAPAGIGAARRNARTLVLEYLAGLGGVGTMGMIPSYYWGFRGGFTKEVPGTSWKPLDRAEWWRRTLRDAGATVWFGALGCGAYLEGNRVAGVVVATPYGRGVVLAKTVIDATGNSDVAAAAGAQTMHTDGSELAQQGTGLPRVRLGARGNNTDFTITDETDMLDVWHLLVYAKHRWAAEFDMGQLVDTRERRRIVGDFVMNILDQVNGRTYPDTISVAYSNFDTHGYTVDPYLLLEHPERKGITVKVPYRCLLPKGLDGILVTGLGMSVHRDAVPLVRMQPDIQNQGYAAGLAAAEAARRSGATRKVDIRALQKDLAAIGIVPESVLGEGDSYPIPDERIAEAVRTKDIPVILTRPEVSSPLLRRAFRAAPDPAGQLDYARILGVMGDAAGLDILIAELEKQGWDKGWNYTGMSQFGRALSPVDTLIVAMGRTRDRRAVDAIVRKAALLDAGSEFSHHRAVALALESIGDPAAAGALAGLLRKPGIGGHVADTVEKARELSGLDPNDNRARSLSIRELSLARALYRCGDRDGLGKEILSRYARDLRGHLARHARAVLAGVR